MYNRVQDRIPLNDSHAGVQAWRSIIPLLITIELGGRTAWKLRISPQHADPAFHTTIPPLGQHFEAESRVLIISCTSRCLHQHSLFLLPTIFQNNALSSSRSALSTWHRIHSCNTATSDGITTAAWSEGLAYHRQFL